MGREAEALGAEGDLVLDSEVEELRLRLVEDDGGEAGELGGAGMARIAPEQLNAAAEAAAGVVRDEASESEAEGALAAAGGAEQRDGLAGLNAEVDPIQDEVCL
ncbi:MAG TPA: hypothetical protein VFN74_16305 [Chloroflexota bacterium]|nr:hypothetical protein [Chloroflexota bacterium]